MQGQCRQGSGPELEGTVPCGGQRGSRPASRDFLTGPILRLGVTFMSSEVLYPLTFDASSLSVGAAEYLQDSSLGLLVNFFISKELKGLKQEDRREDWYQDWIDHKARQGLYASILS